MGQATQNFNLTRGDGGHGLWQTPGSGLTIEYSFEVLERIRNWTLEAYRALARGGIEVGGVLFGRHEGRLVRVLDVRPIACEHAYGPAFVLSERDEKALTALLAEAPQDAELAGLEPVGWYVSHTRSGLSLSERDLDLHARFFPEWWQIALVARQAEEGAISAGFFVPARNGSMGAEPAGGPFEVRPFRPGAASPVVSGSRVVEAELPADSQPELQPEPQPRQSSAPPLPAKQPSIEAAEPELVPRFEPDPPPQRLAVSEPVRHEHAPFGAQFGRSDEPEPNKAERGWLWWIPFGLALFVGGVAAGPMMLERAPAPLPAAPAKAVSLGL
ncbi:MAG TPA: hypothetical protein VN428_27035, partial [Bryobacteraceae bacterium]|nr:hypothetical protein [Bryobacteraceae bacterium]